jgi:hypothetical protein
MPLSDEEQRRFNELIGTLEDTEKRVEKVESRIKAKPVLYALLIPIGLLGLIAGVMTQLPIIGVFSFALMVVGAYKFMPFLDAERVLKAFPYSNK